MYSLTALLSFCLATLLVGLLVGSYVTQRKGLFSQRQAELEKQLSEMHKEQQSYQQEVNTHFEKSAELLNQLTDSYKDVHRHLAEGAQSLATSGQSNFKALAQDEEESNLEQPLNPPLDYAATSGTLREDFGLEKATENEERTDSGYPKTPA